MTKLTAADVTNQAAIASLRALTSPLHANSARAADYLIALEGVVVGVLLLVCKPGGDEATLEVMVAGVRERLADARLRIAETRGTA